MRKLARVPVLKAMSIACVALLLCGVSPVAAQLDQDPDALLDSAEKAMQESGDSLRQKESGKSLSNQSDAIQKLEEYKRATERSQSSSRDRNVITQRDLDDLLRQIEKAAREGNREAAQRMLEQLAQIMENLQMAQPGQSGDSDMEQALNELSDMIRKQQQLRDKTFKQGQDSRRDRSRGKQQGDQSMSDLQQDQQALRDRLKKLQDELAKRGLAQKGQKGQSQKGQKGQQGDQGQPGQNGDQDGDQGDEDSSLDDADGAMGDAGSKLGEGNADGAVDSQGKALDALRKGAQKMAEAMQQGDGDGQGDGPGNRAGRQQSGANQTDPLGRPLHGRDLSDDYTVKIPGEIDAQRVRRILEELRRRLGDTSRPQIELDYIERLLKDF
ncbi:DUF4175 family protein [Bradyrhizobium sp. 180]|uniref:DUF4175 family protein n=1 Tax=unclassified Bradyrhizobium TaxID=2631580 RepID=UPI001FF9CC21|nr:MULTISPECIES: DUF4175 family protein [unclassified Bradyrhizobium]MCK1423325.1 DUF4175 family protein [Bradyrhizobium sp. CW12]MCK1493716.1 DUF4175 family protein [Bradyrhizobium sp. 180]MCK1528154.1 DUF4175 family protein [Bradyrhizobium sp. 182]MCK1617646.1 DUF4175 family protein [Bradyrhizobium sp. 159]MCK1644909.1 DUF4175 family protein [Bradyrhizobium sp. 154]